MVDVPIRPLCVQVSPAIGKLGGTQSCMDAFQGRKSPTLPEIPPRFPCCLPRDLVTVQTWLSWIFLLISEHKECNYCKIHVSVIYVRVIATCVIRYSGNIYMFRALRPEFTELPSFI